MNDILEHEYTDDRELSEELKSLYNHWNQHTIAPKGAINSEVNPQVMSDINWFISERMNVYYNKEKGIHPYSTDTILSQYRFCNIYRELDRQTITFHTLLKNIQNDFELWLLNIAYCRFVARPETIEHTGLLSFDENKNNEVYRKLIEMKSPKFGSAYVFPISLLRDSFYHTRERFFCFYLPTIIKQCASRIQSFDKKSVLDALDEVLPIFGYNFRFHWTEIFIDIAYQYPQYIDLFKPFPIGPGSLPTMKALRSDSDPVKLCLQLPYYSLPIFPYLLYNGNPVYLSCENWEGIGCEFRKYSNLTLGHGRRRKYTSY